MNIMNNWKTKTFVFGALAGTLTGLVAAYIIIQRAEKYQSKPQLSAGEGVKLSLGVLGLLRLVSDIIDTKKTS
jgi:hypothetical protein